MSPTIRVSDDTYEALKDQAEPFVDTPDSVIRRLLGLDVDDEPGADRSDFGEPDSSAEARKGAGRAAASSGRSGHTSSGSGRTTKRTRRHPAKRGASRAPRAPRGSLLRDEAYERPILQTLADSGGRAAKNEVIDALEPILGDQLAELDRSEIASGEIRWRNRAQFVRLRLVQRGLMEKDSPRGVWELSEAGRTHLAELASANGTTGARS